VYVLRRFPFLSRLDTATGIRWARSTFIIIFVNSSGLFSAGTMASIAMQSLLSTMVSPMYVVFRVRFRCAALQLFCSRWSMFFMPNLSHERRLALKTFLHAGGRSRDLMNEARPLGWTTILLLFWPFTNKRRSILPGFFVHCMKMENGLLRNLKSVV